MERIRVVNSSPSSSTPECYVASYLRLLSSTPDPFIVLLIETPLPDLRYPSKWTFVPADSPFYLTANKLR